MKKLLAAVFFLLALSDPAAFARTPAGPDAAEKNAPPAVSEGGFCVPGGTVGRIQYDHNGVLGGYGIVPRENGGTGSDATSLVVQETIASPEILIYDDDCTYDVDCVYTLSALHHWIDQGNVKVLAFLADSGTLYSTPVFKIFEDYYGHGSIPIGAYKGHSVKPGIFVDSPWNAGLVAAFDPGDTSAKYEDCVTVYRKALAGADDNSVNIVETGFLTCLSDLMRSPADSISAHSGEDLLKAKVKTLYVMGGDYTSGSEFNFEGDPTDANFVVSNWKTANGYPNIYVAIALAPQIRYKFC